MPIEINVDAPALDDDLRATAASLSFPTLGHFLEQGFVDPEIRTMTGPVKLVGRAVTVRTVVPDSALVHRATDLLRPGDVLVVDAGGEGRHAPVGEMVALAATARGATGIVVDGMCTDLEEIRAMGIGLFARGTSLLTTKLHGLPEGGINVPVLCGGVRVEPGHVVLADGNGVAVLAPEVLTGVLDAVRASDAGEEELRAHVEAGGSLAERTGATRLVHDALGARAVRSA